MADVCLILEGTYPFAKGGVSTWVQALITGLPELTFSLVHLSGQNGALKAVFETPPNLVELKVIPLDIGKKEVELAGLVGQVPEAKVYHALSTGFAGLLAAKKKAATDRPMLLTEHGIYWHEIALGVDELECGFKILDTGTGRLNLGRTWEKWLQSFKDFARQAYSVADCITTVCSANQQMQLSLAADARKSHVIFNGIDLKKYNAIHKDFRVGKKRIGLVGRVTSIKDVKTFIRACAVIRRKMPDALFYVIGPTEQDWKYYRECVHLASELNLDELVFTGEVDPIDYYHELDVIVLTSRSEGQPYALIEAMAAGIPVVATDVGGCRELLNPPDMAGCSAGTLCPVGQEEKIADAIVRVCSEKRLWEKQAFCGRKIARQKHNLRMMIDTYRSLYLKFNRAAGVL